MTSKFCLSVCEGLAWLNSALGLKKQNNYTGSCYVLVNRSAETSKRKAIETLRYKIKLQKQNKYTESKVSFLNPSDTCPRFHSWHLIIQSILECTSRIRKDALYNHMLDSVLVSIHVFAICYEFLHFFYIEPLYPGLYRNVGGLRERYIHELL